MSSRRRQTPWIHRYSRPLIAAIAGLGAINTGYLTFKEFLGGEVACPTSGCEQVLSSPYATVSGLPLALFGLLAYLSIIVFALAPLVLRSEKGDRKKQESALENWTWLLLFAGTTAMMVFSAYLMYIMFTEFVIPNGLQSICYYCLASAAFALTLFILTLLGRDWEDSSQLFFTGIIVGMVTLVGTLGVYSTVNAAFNPTDGPQMPPISEVSGESEAALARHLKQVGAVMYGAYWCPHCQDQKRLFGEKAAQIINYVECSPNGPNAPQAEACQAKEIRSYPTWEINGQLQEPGVIRLEQLAELTNYQGPRNFQISLPTVP